MLSDENKTSPWYMVTDAASEISEDRTATIVYVCLQFILMAVILTTNGIVMYIIIKYIRPKTSPTFILIINLVVADIFMAIVLPVQAVTRLGVLPLRADYMCFLRLSTMTLASFASLFSVLLTAVDRYFAVCWCAQYHNHKMTTKTRVIASIIVVWIFSFIIAIYPVHYFATDSAIRLLAGECVYVDSVSKGYSLFVPVQYFLVVFLMCFLYNKIFRVALKRKRLISSENMLYSRVWRLRRELNTAKFMAVVLIVFTFCWTPFAIFQLYTSLSSDVGLLVTRFGHASVFLGILNSAVNPFIYPCQNRVFKKALERVFRMKV